jgi:hypothetical protein
MKVAVKEMNILKLSDNSLMVNEKVVNKICGVWVPVSKDIVLSDSEILSIFDFLEEDKRLIEAYCQNQVDMLLKELKIEKEK